MNADLWMDLANVAACDAAAIRDSYAWPPRAPLSAEERREVDRLDALSRRFAYRAFEAGWVPPMYRGG